MNTKQLRFDTEKLIETTGAAKDCTIIPIVAYSDSGKDTVATKVSQVLEEKGFSTEIKNMSDTLKFLAKKQNLDYSKKNGRYVLSDIAEFLSQDFGEHIITQILHQQAEKDVLIIPGVRLLGTIEYQKAHTTGNRFGISLEATEEVRLGIMKSTNRYGYEQMSDEELKQSLRTITQKEKGFRSFQNVPGCRKLCNYTVKNAFFGDTTHLEHEVEAIFI